MTSEGEENSRLESWKEISNYLGKSGSPQKTENIVR